MENHSEGVAAYLTAIRSLQDGILGQAHTLGTVADLMADAVMDERRIFLFGTGHSHLIAEEGHYRAGGLACVVPILVPALMLHESSLMASQIERTLGLSQIILDRYDPAPGELIFIFSASGVNALPVEMALTAKERGLIVVGVTNVAYCKAVPVSSIGKRLIEIADHVIDCGGIPGDSIVNIPASDWRVGPTSTVMCATIWNCLVTETVFRLQSREAKLSIYLSNNMPGAAEHNRELVQAWIHRNPHL